MKDKNISILKHIVKYCVEINETLNNYNVNKDEFMNNHIFKKAVSMGILQIGELSNNLTEEYRESTINEMNWRVIRGMRNHFAHGYGSMDIELIFDTAIKDIPVLKEFCVKEIERLSSSD